MDATGALNFNSSVDGSQTKVLRDFTGTWSLLNIAMMIDFVVSNPI